MNKNTQLFIRLFLFHLFLLGFFSFAEARSLRRVHQTWELLMGNRLVMTYYSLGYLGDLYRHKIYNSSRTLRYLRTLQELVKKEKSFLSSFKYPAGRSNKLLFRRLKAVVDLLDLACNSLRLSVKKTIPLKQFLIYRNSIARDIGQIFAMKALKKRRYYRGRWRFGLRALGHYLGSNVVMAYLMFGLIADGYFQLAFQKEEILPRVKMVIQFLRTSKIAILHVKTSVPRRDRSYIQSLARTTIFLINEGISLRDFITSRRRPYLIAYRKWKILAWRSLNHSLSL